MDVGVVLLSAIVASPPDLRMVADEAERTGVHSLWVTERIAMPVEIHSKYPYRSDGLPAFDFDSSWTESMVTLGFLAALTRRVRLGTAVIPLFTRDPVSLAKQAASVDVLSDGRLELGIGAGWLVEEAQALGRPFDSRAHRLDEAIDVMHAAWTHRSFSHKGQFYSIPEVGVHPHPVQGAQLPIWIGGHSSAAIRTAAERGHGVLTWLAGPDRVREIATELRSQRSTAHLAAAMPLKNSPAETLSQARRLQEAGADLILLIAYGDGSKTVQELEMVSAIFAEP
jgi:probable F420-dependent oxidoreductase